jgi:hypothetical protein
VSVYSLIIYLYIAWCIQYVCCLQIFTQKHIPKKVRREQEAAAVTQKKGFCTLLARSSSYQPAALTAGLLLTPAQLCAARAELAAAVNSSSSSSSAASAVQKCAASTHSSAQQCEQLLHYDECDSCETDWGVEVHTDLHFLYDSAEIYEPSAADWLPYQFSQLNCGSALHWATTTATASICTTNHSNSSEGNSVIAEAAR